MLNAFLIVLLYWLVEQKVIFISLFIQSYFFN
jgi:hypothetical protein